MIPFRIIAIVESRQRLLDVLQVATKNADLHIGLMLRDDQHRPEYVQVLADVASSQTIPDNVRLIGNTVAVPGAAFLHLTSAQLHTTFDTPTSQSYYSLLPFGCSTHTLREATRAQKLGASYVTLSPIFPTDSKPGHAGIGLARLERISHAVAIPVFALGGVTAGNVADCLDAGAYGIASISLFSQEQGGRLLTVLDMIRKLHH